MRSGMQEDDIALLGVLLQRRHHALEVKQASLRVEVRVLRTTHPRQIPDGVMIRPRRIRQPDLSGLHDALEEERPEVVRARPRDSLHRGDALLGCVLGLVGFLAVEVKQHVPRQSDKAHVTLDSRVLVSGDVVLFDEVLLGFPHHGERPWLAVVGAVNSHTQTDFFGISVVEELAVQVEDLVCGHWGQFVENRHCVCYLWVSVCFSRG